MKIFEVSKCSGHKAFLFIFKLFIGQSSDLVMG